MSYCSLLQTPTTVAKMSMLGYFFGHVKVYLECLCIDTCIHTGVEVIFFLKHLVIEQCLV